MTHIVSPSAPVQQEDSVPDDGPTSEVEASAELPSERSRFSRWLASFGLGETTIPLLRPLKTPRGGNR